MVDTMEIGLTEDVDELPSERSDEVVTAISGITEPEVTDGPRLVSVSSMNMPSNVLVTHVGENLLLDQDSIKTTRIIIHNPSTLDVLKNGAHTITFNSLNRSISVPEKNTINFDPSVYDQVLPVRCRNMRGELHKNKFGSGNRGRSILVNGIWYTPSEFEALGGRASSKDWKRSIRYGGRTLQFLIEQGILRPHAAACTCGNCCDDNPGDGSPDISSGPIRLFTPYKRRKTHRKRLKVMTDVELPTRDNIVSAPAELHTEEISSSSLTTERVALLPLVTQSSGSTVCTDSVIVSPETRSGPKFVPSVVDFQEQKQWWQLEEMIKNTVRQVLELQKHVEIVKEQCVATRETALQDLRAQMEDEKKEAVSACRLETQLALSKANIEAKSEREAAVQQAIHQTQLEMHMNQQILPEHPENEKRCANCDREALSECTGCHRVSYCGAFCQRKDWLTHREECGETVLAADCSALPDSDDPTS